MTEPIKLPSCDDLIRMAKEAGFHLWYSTPEHACHFGCVEALVRLAVEQATAEMKAENERLRADAERYRWLICFVSNEEMERITGRWPMSDEEVDAAVDEARDTRVGAPI